MLSPTPLPWIPGSLPLMLAPMQGLTNRALRDLFVDWVRPDVVFTEFMRVGGAGKGLAASDRRELGAEQGGVPLVVQLVGHDVAGLVAAAQTAQVAGARHLNLNLGCPYGRMGTGPTGGGLLREPQRLDILLPALRAACHGSFSVKIRAGYDDPRQILDLLPLFEDVGLDYLILHPRTVQQEYTGAADHTVTAAVVAATRLPVIANGDVRSAATGRRVLRDTGAAGLMLGRGAIADPWLFERLRGRAPALPTPDERVAELRRYLAAMLERYQEIFCGEVQALGKVKALLACLDEPQLARPLRQLRKARTSTAFVSALAALG